MERPALTGRTTRIAAARVLVIAPHFDDEVLGCGGLLVQLAAAGTAVRVLFLTDGSGGVEVVEDRQAYAARRRVEAERALRVLGAAGCACADLPDGRLGGDLVAAAAAITRELGDFAPDLLLAPSPLEVSADHRAAFAALHRTLSPRRDSTGNDLRILLYEVNHPAFPDVLVDVSREVPRLEAAMAEYQSQIERHPYLRAALGLRRFRTLSLPAGIEAAEGYRMLRLEDFATRGLARLVRDLGGVPDLEAVTEGPSISVILRTKDREALLAEALRSLDVGTYRNAELVVVNDGGARPRLPEDLELPVTLVELPHNRGRAAAANAGVQRAAGEYVAFLDDDDLAEPEHLATLAGLVRASGVEVAYTDAAVAVYELGPGGWRCRARRLPYSRDFDADLLLFDNYIPFHTLLIPRQLFAETGPFDESLPFFEDWDFLIRLSKQTWFHHFAQVTCEYRHFRGSGHHVLGERPWERADFATMKARVIEKHWSHVGPERLARVVLRLRGEAVEAAEAGRLREEQLERVVVRLREEAVEAAEAGRLREEQLAQVVVRLREEAVETAEAGRLSQERLEAVIRAMEATRAWRIHHWLRRRWR